MSTKNWKDLAAAKKAHQQKTIPGQWIIANPPPKDQLDVSALPESYGVLSPKDVEITNSQVDVLLAKLADGSWSAVDVATAFSKRAVIAHQLVCPALTLSRFQRGTDDPWALGRLIASPKSSSTALWNAQLDLMNTSRRRVRRWVLCTV